MNYHYKDNTIFKPSYLYSGNTYTKLEQLERLHSDDTHHHLMITYTIESYWIPSQKKTKSKIQI